MCFPYKFHADSLFFVAMVRASVLRPAIVRLHLVGVPRHEIVRRLNAPKSTVYKTIERFLEKGDLLDRPGRGRPVTVSTPRNREVIRKRIHRNPRKSLTRLASELNISETSTRRIIKTQLQLRPYKIQKRQDLTERQMALRRERCPKLLARCAKSEHLTTVWSDEKVFTKEIAVNPQNHRILAQSPQEAAEMGGIAGRSSHPQYLMVWGGVCATGKTPLIFVQSGVKINKDYYIKEVLEKHLVPWTKKHFGKKRWTFQQDSAPAHKAKMTIEWLEQHVPNFIPPSEWPPNSPDLNPLDFSVWGVLQEKVNATPHSDLESLRLALVKAWNELDDTYLRELALSYDRRLKACIRAKGGHIEIH